MFLDVCGLGRNDCVDHRLDGHTLIGSNVSDTLAGFAGCLQHIFIYTKRVGENSEVFRTAFGPVLLPFGAAGFAFFLRWRILCHILSIGDVR